MQRFDNGTGRLDKMTFKKCLNKLSNATTEAEIQKLLLDLGEAGDSRGSAKKGGNELMDFKKFALQVGEAAKAKALPNYVLQGPKGSSSMAKGRQGQGNGNPMQAFEAEKKYKKNLDALKQEIEEKNREIEGLRKEVKDCHDREKRLDTEKKSLEGRLVDKHSKPPRET